MTDSLCHLAMVLPLWYGTLPHFVVQSLCPGAQHHLPENRRAEPSIGRCGNVPITEGEEDIPSSHLPLLLDEPVVPGLVNLCL